jgi:hypothetical protein
MDPEGSLPHSQVLPTCLYPEPAQSSPYPTSHFLKIHLSIIFPSTSSTLSLSINPPLRNTTDIFPFTTNVCNTGYPLLRQPFVQQNQSFPGNRNRLKSCSIGFALFYFNYSNTGVTVTQ